MCRRWSRKWPACLPSSSLVLSRSGTETTIERSVAELRQLKASSGIWRYIGVNWKWIIVTGAVAMALLPLQQEDPCSKCHPQHVTLWNLQFHLCLLTGHKEYGRRQWHRWRDSLAKREDRHLEQGLGLSALQESQASAAWIWAFLPRARSLTIAGEIPRSTMHSRAKFQSFACFCSNILHPFLRYHKDNSPEEIQKPLKSEPRNMQVCRALLHWNKAGRYKLGWMWRLWVGQRVPHSRFSTSTFEATQVSSCVEFAPSRYVNIEQEAPGKGWQYNLR